MDARSPRCRAGDASFLWAQNSLPVIYEMMHFVFLSLSSPRKHLNPLMSQLKAHTVCSNARLPSLPEVLGSRNPLKTACGDKLLPELIHLVERHMYCNFSEHGFITQLIITFNGDCFHFCHYCTLWFNSPGSEEAEQKLRQRGRQIHTASSSNSFCLVIWLQLRDCGLIKQWQEKWKIHVPLNTITFVNAAVCLCMLFLMDCAFACHLKWAEMFLVSLHYTGVEFGENGMNPWCCVQGGMDCFLCYSYFVILDVPYMVQQKFIIIVLTWWKVTACNCLFVSYSLT